jgi:hypothetical protein
MRVPQVSERIKEAPAQALRGVFAGIGQVLLVADRLRNKTPADQQVRQTRVPEPSATRAEPVPPVQQAPPTTSAPSAPPASGAKKVPDVRDFDKTGNVRLLTSEKGRADDTATASGVAAVAEDAALTTQTEPGAPLPNYDQLSIASLRARLRNLDIAQVRQLAEYEKAHAARAGVMTMFERRIARLEAETTPEERGEAEAEAEVEAREEEAAEVQEEIGAEAEGEA